MRDPWCGIQKGDRFYLAAWNARWGDIDLWCEVTDLWFAPVRGERKASNGYMVAVRLMGRSNKQAYRAATLAGKRFRNVADAERAAAAVLNWHEVDDA